MQLSLKINISCKVYFQITHDNVSAFSSSLVNLLLPCRKRKEKHVFVSVMHSWNKHFPLFFLFTSGTHFDSSLIVLDSQLAYTFAPKHRI